MDWTPHRFDPNFVNLVDPKIGMVRPSPKAQHGFIVLQGAGDVGPELSSLS